MMITSHVRWEMVNVIADMTRREGGYWPKNLAGNLQAKFEIRRKDKILCHNALHPRVSAPQYLSTKEFQT